MQQKRAAPLPHSAIFMTFQQLYVASIKQPIRFLSRQRDDVLALIFPCTVPCRRAQNHCPPNTGACSCCAILLSPRQKLVANEPTILAVLRAGESRLLPVEDLWLLNLAA